ncbi:lytic transglycosylase domain-containing protein [Nocardia jejuensis]|uniref:lytic transglycosylase domain-containing protein n=1 Tax=Nocardia jejuensis TaxID=328049 RepID=UPI00082D36BB|nr:lytic murein transglycosylase [Nocardia jejuensis]
MAKRISAPVTASALLIAGLVTAGSATNTTVHTAAPQVVPEALLAAAATDGSPSPDTASPGSDQLVGLVPAAPEAARKLSAMTPPADGSAPFAGTIPLQSISLAGGTGALGIPEIVLAAYRNAELALASSTPGCGLPWNLLAGIGRIESLHASSGRTDAAGTTISPIYGPALDGTLPGNEVIKANDGGYVRAVGPMQFLPSTWANYAADGNGDGISDPNNVFDAALAAGKYLCSGGLDLRDQQQQVKAVLRYNNSMSYAANVLSWSNAYKTGGTPAAVAISGDLVPPGALTASAPDMTAASAVLPTTEAPPTTAATKQPGATQVMITIPGLPAIPCGVFCPTTIPDANSCDPAAAQQKPAQGATDAKPEDAVAPGDDKQTAQPEQALGADGKPVQNQVQVLCTQEVPNQAAEQPQAAAPAPEQNPAPAAPAEPEAAAPAAPETVQPAPAAPGIVLPFGITIPVPAPAAP